MIEFCSPAYGPRRTGVVGRRGKGLAAGESIGNQSEVFAADGEIGGKIGEFAVFKILQGFLPGNPAGGSRHHLHQPPRADGAFGHAQKAGFLPDQAENPFGFKTCIAGS